MLQKKEKITVFFFILLAVITLPMIGVVMYETGVEKHIPVFDNSMTFHWEIVEE